MNILIVHAHPEPKSFNAAMTATAHATLAATGHAVRQSDLYAMDFDPRSSRANFLAAKDPDYFKPQIEEIHASETDGFAPVLAEELDKLAWCELMIWQFPLWWFGLPAVLKGWVDRVFAMGRVYGGDHIYETGTQRGKRALLSLTTGGPADAYQLGGFNGDIEAILRPIQRGMLQFVGFDVLAPHVVYAPVRQSHDVLEQELRRFADRLAGIADEGPIDVGAY